MENAQPTPIGSEHSTLQMRVLYADTDKMNVVYYANYLKWFEAGRAHYMRCRGLTYREIEESGIQLPVIEAHVNYSRPARYDDLIEIHSRVTELKGARVRFAYRIERGGELLAEGHTAHAAVNPSGRPVRLPEHVRLALMGEDPQAPHSSGKNQ